MNIHKQTYIHTCVRACACTYIDTYMRACTYTYIHTDIHTYTQTHRVFACTHTHTYIHTYIQSCTYIQPIQTMMLAKRYILGTHHRGATYIHTMYKHKHNHNSPIWGRAFTYIHTYLHTYIHTYTHSNHDVGKEIH